MVPERLSELLEETAEFDRIYAHDGNIPVGFWPEGSFFYLFRFISFCELRVDVSNRSAFTFRRTTSMDGF